MRFLLPVLSCLLVACGARTLLEVDPPPGDAGATDGMPDTPTRELRIDCGRSVQFTTPRLPLFLSAEILEAPDPVVAQGWTLVDRPAGAIASLAPSSGPSATLQQDLPGFYAVRFDARDAAGRTASCDVQVESIVGPPRAICPESEVRTPVGVPVTIEGAGFDDIAVVGYRWQFLTGPSMASLIPLESAITTFRADVAGQYQIQLEVRDEDGATDTCVTRVRVIGPPSVSCPGAVEGPSRQPIFFVVGTSDDTRVASGTAELLSAPDGSRVVLGADSVTRRGDTFTVTFTPDRAGPYRVRFTATDEDGLTASCDVDVIALETPPDAICPEVVETRPLVPTDVVGSGVDDGAIVSYRWETVALAPGSTARMPMPANRAATVFTPDIAGEYRLRLTVRDDSGHEASCETRVRAIATEGLRVEMFWDTVSDMDLHLLQPGDGQWRTEDSCYYANCLRGGPDWGVRGVDEDDPSLDIDNTREFGPENINVELPENGIFRVGVHAFSNNARAVTVRVYCGGSTTEPRQTFGPVPLNGSSEDFWRVADVTISGATCTITPLGTPGRPDIRSAPSGPFPR